MRRGSGDERLETGGKDTEMRKRKGSGDERLEMVSKDIEMRKRRGSGDERLDIESEVWWVRLLNIEVLRENN